MDGGSGAKIRFTGDLVTKKCRDAEDQYKWLNLDLHLNENIRVPYTNLISKDEYEIEFIEGHRLNQEASTHYLNRVLNQIDVWKSIPCYYNVTWDSYLERLEAHVYLANSNSMNKAMNLISKIKEFPKSFGHGDLTFENILINGEDIYLIDPNFSSNLYESYILDYGKLLQSAHSDYHNCFDSNPGLDLKHHFDEIKNKLIKENIYQECLYAEITHIMRLRKYRPEIQRKLVDALLDHLMIHF